MVETLSIPVDSEVRERLGRIADQSGRTQAAVAAEAIALYAESEEAHLSAIREGLLDADGGRVVDHSEVAAWLKTWGTPHEASAPR